MAKAAIFGSMARGEAKKRSDVDILLSFDQSKSLLDFVGLELELQEKLGRKVDLVTYDSIYPPLRPYILKDEKIIYEKRSSGFSGTYS